MVGKDVLYVVMMRRADLIKYITVSINLYDKIK